MFASLCYEKTLLTGFLFFLSVIACAQNDSIEVLIDTIHVRGFVFDKFDRPMVNVKVRAEHEIEYTRTTKSGFFELKGIRNNSHIYFNTDTLSDILFNNTSRFIIYHLTEPINRLSSYPDKIFITAKRTLPKQPIKKKEIKFIGFPNYDRGGTYPGGIAKFYKFIVDSLKYPEKAIKNNIEGAVGIQFDVSKTGALSNFKIIKDIGYDCAEALITVLKKSKKWNPGLGGGRPTIRKYYIEIPFKLTD